MAWANPIVDNSLPNIHALSRVALLVAPLKALRETGIIPSRQRRFTPESLPVVIELVQSRNVNLAALRRRLPYGSIEREFNSS